MDIQGSCSQILMTKKYVVHLALGGVVLICVEEIHIELIQALLDGSHLCLDEPGYLGTREVELIALSDESLVIVGVVLVEEGADTPLWRWLEDGWPRSGYDCG